MSYRCCVPRIEGKSDYHCRNWRGCPGYSFYQPFEIETNFCKQQVLWLLLNLDTLEIGDYPADPEPTGYVGGGGKPVFRAGARFLRAADLFAEITARLSRCGNDGDTLVHEVRFLDAGIGGLSQAAKNALNYCCGYKRKRRKFKQWLVDREYRRMLILRK